MNFRKAAPLRLEGMHRERYSWFNHWRELADYISPRRHRWFISTNQGTRGNAMNSKIKDPTATLAARNLAAGLKTGKVSAARPWFKLRLEGQDTESSGPVSIWLAEVETRMTRVFSESNFYNSVGVLLDDLVVFGTAPMLIYEDYEDVIRCYNLAAGEYFLALDDRLVPNVLYREFTLTVAQVVQWFGIESCSRHIKMLYQQDQSRPGNLSQEIVICHGIELNDDAVETKIAKKFRYREIYWEAGSQDTEILSERGYFDRPFVAPRWGVMSSNDPYGHSPAMDALPDIKQLQQETIRKAQGIDKLVNPPMMADVQMKNQPASLLPGGVSYVANLAQNPGMKPIYQITPPVNELKEDIMEIQQRIRSTFHNDLFLMISQMDAIPTATEILERREEKLTMLGPVIDRIDRELLDNAIERTYGIMLRGGLLPPPPPELQGRTVQVEYVSMLASAQNASSTVAMERVLAMVGTIAQGQAAVGAVPDAMDNIDTDVFVQTYGAQLHTSPKVFRDAKARARLRQSRNEGAEEKLDRDDAGAIVEAGKTLSQTDVGGGVNALQLMAGGGTLQ